jgi:phosphatidylserine decarboxylase
MDPQVKTIQPGSGWVMRGELAWGNVRRWWLRTMRPGYVAKMRALRTGQQGGCPFDPIDPRDVKYYQNQSTFRWARQDDPFRWRDSLPFVRAGLAELIWIGGFFVALTALAMWPALSQGGLWWLLVLPPAVVTLLILWFFRNPNRRIPSAPGLVISPADGKVVAINEIDDPDIGPAVEFGIFLSIFNVHVNRSSIAGKVIGLRYRPGKFLNALRPESARENEHLELRLQQTEAPYRFIKIRQITGAIARRIVCWVAPGDDLERGEIFGMIKLGSRTELVVPRTADLEIECKIGDKVQAGSSLMARYRADSAMDQGE